MVLRLFPFFGFQPPVSSSSGTNCGDIYLLIDVKFDQLSDFIQWFVYQINIDTDLPCLSNSHAQLLMIIGMPDEFIFPGIPSSCLQAIGIKAEKNKLIKQKK